MIRKLKIHCFQSHKDTELDFAPGVNIIVGEGNDIGKTAIFRALNWVISNRPLGDSFVSNFQDGPANVELITEDASVCRIKGGRENKYVLTNQEYDEEVFTAFGTAPPEMVKSALNFLDVNIQQQISLPFLVLDSPGQIAQHIRNIARLDDIDKVISLLKAKEKTTKDCLGVYRESLEAAEAKLTELSKIDVERLEVLLTQAENIMADTKDIDILSSSLIQLITNLKEIEKNWIRLPENILQIVESTNDLIVEKGRISSRINELSNLIKELKGIEEDWIHLPENTNQLVENANTTIAEKEKISSRIDKLDSLINEFKELKKVNLPTDITDKLSKIEGVKIQYNIIVARIKEIGSLIEKLKGVNEKIDVAKREEIVNQKQFDELLEQLTVCPICTSKLTDGTKQHLLKEYKE